MRKGVHRYLQDASVPGLPGRAGQSLLHDFAGFAAARRFGLRQPAVSAGVDPAQDIGSGEVAVRGRSGRPMTRFVGGIDGALERDLALLVARGTGADEPEPSARWAVAARPASSVPRRLPESGGGRCDDNVCDLLSSSGAIR